MLDTKQKMHKRLCPKCGGRIVLDSDVYGWYEHCLYCGLTRDVEVQLGKK
jgi:hypothetical protein